MTWYLAVNSFCLLQQVYETFLLFCPSEAKIILSFGHSTWHFLKMVTDSADTATVIVFLLFLILMLLLLCATIMEIDQHVGQLWAM